MCTIVGLENYLPYDSKHRETEMSVSYICRVTSCDMKNDIEMSDLSVGLCFEWG
jgi:hypothetical protein